MVITKPEAKLLKDIYYDNKHIGALRGAIHLYREAKAKNPKITQAKVKEWLKGQSTYSLWRPARKNYSRNPVIAKSCGALVQFDLGDFRSMAENGTTWLLVAVDTFSRFVFTRFLSGRTSKDIIEAMSSIFATGYHPECAMADPAGEHISRVTRKFFKDSGVHLYHTASKIHAPSAERWLRTLKVYLQRYWHSNNTNKWIEATKAFTDNYNHTVTRAHGEKPFDVMFDGVADERAFKRLYPCDEKEEKEAPKKDAPKVGDHVRINRIRGIHEKESSKEGLWSKSYYTVKRITRNQKYPMAELTDAKGETIRGRFYGLEMQTISIAPEAALFEIEKLLYKRKLRNRWYYRVKWRNYDSSHNSWVLVKDIKQVHTDAPTDVN